MNDESSNERPGPNGLNPPYSGSGRAGDPSDPGADRLPPPMFPDGTRRLTLRAPASALDRALIDPDAPIVRSEFPRTPSDYEKVVRGAAVDIDEGVVTGIGDDSHEDAELELLRVDDGDPHVTELIRAVKRLSDALGARGEAGLRATSDMNRFEAILRAYCVGYLTQAREERE